MTPREQWRWFGQAGHLIVGQDCRFHLATQVGPWWVSTVGEYLPDSQVREILAESRGVALAGKGDARRASYMKQIGYEEIGLGRKFETMVFRAGAPCTALSCGACGAPCPDSWSELDSLAANSAGEATRNHEAMCEKWANLDMPPTEDEEP